MDSAIAPNAWQSSAAYLYILELDRIELAWEYLRRNKAYRGQWQDAGDAAPVTSAKTWHCKRLVDPKIDARNAFPEWLPNSVSALRVVPAHPEDESLKFSLWRLPGHKILRRTRSAFLLHGHTARSICRFSLSPRVTHQSAFAYQIPAGLDPDLATSLIRQINAAMTAELHSETHASVAIGRPKRESLMHMRTLQALDGAEAGATHRAIAESLYGTKDVWRRWSKYSELPSHIRYLLRRGRALVDGGYFRLLLVRDSL